MKINTKLQTLKATIITICMSMTASPVFSASTGLGGTELKTISITKQALYPESIEYNPKTKKFLVGSFRDGAIYEIGQDGSHHRLIDDKRISSALGLKVDSNLNRLLVASADLGASKRPYAKGPKKLAALGIYELSTGKALHFVDLGKLHPDSNHLANGVTVDSLGNAYVTDSFSPVIYKVDTQGKASVFLEDKRFEGEGINLNGIIYHPDGYLLVVKKSEGVLFKVPVNHPDKFSEVKLNRKLIGADGLTLVNNKDLIVVANQASGVETDAAFALRSGDNWTTAHVADKYSFGDVYPTTSVIKENKIYALHSSLNVLVRSPKKEELTQTATIQQIGNVIP